MTRRTWWFIAAVATAAALAVVVLRIEAGRAPSLVLFVGRFHPTVVHFPIALLLLGVFVEVLAPYVAAIEKIRPAVPVILLLGAVSAVASVVLGYLLSLDGGYEPGLLSLHQWLGLTVMVLAFALALVTIRRRPAGRWFSGAMLALGVLVIVAGHLGGSLARGSGYLTYYLPSPVKQFVGLDADLDDGLIANVDSARVYADLVRPVLEKRCTKCHGASKSKGDLRLDSPEAIERGGRDGAALVAGNPAQSEMLRRITLPPYDEDAMPPDGEPPLDVGETELIRWWIANGASFDLKVADAEEPTSAVETYLRRVAAPRVTERSGIFALNVPPADTSALEALRREGITAAQITPEDPFLTVSTSALRDRFTDTDLKALRAIGSQIAELDLGHTSITSAGTAALPSMPHLVRLHLEKTSVSDAALAYIASHEYIEYLNLYGTQITDDGLRQLHELESLRSLYLWQTDVTDEGVAELRRAIPSLTVYRETVLLAASDSTGRDAP